MNLYKSLFCLCAVALSAEPISPQEALDRLIKGNERFIAEKSEHPNRMAERRKETAKLQEPFACIMGCSDSRVSPEILFDRGIGELFIVRVAGNIVGPVELDSIEYSAKYLHSSIILVLGHENCGAVTAVLAGKTQEIQAVADLIQPAVDATKGETKDRLEKTIQANVMRMVAYLKKSPVLSALIKEKKIGIVGGYYDFHTGKVELLNDL